MINPSLFSSEFMDWETPQALFDELNSEFRFNLDAAASKENAKCELFFTKELNALACDWGGERGTRVFLNPPYGRGLGQWIQKAFEESKKGCLVVCLLPVRTDTKYFHDFIYGKAEIRFLRGRVKFIKAGGAKRDRPRFLLWS